MLQWTHSGQGPWWVEGIEQFHLSLCASDCDVNSRLLPQRRSGLLSSVE